MESLTQPQFVAFMFTVAGAIIVLVWNQIKTNKKMVEASENLHKMLVQQQKKHDEMLRAQQENHIEVMRVQEKREEMLRVTLNSVEKHIHDSSRDHAVLMERTSTKDQ